MVHGVLISLDKIRPNPFHPPADREHLNQMRKGLKDYRNLPPLVVVKNGGHWDLIDGEHRYTLLKELGVESFPCIRDIGEEHRRLKGLSVCT